MASRSELTRFVSNEFNYTVTFRKDPNGRVVADYESDTCVKTALLCHPYISEQGTIQTLLDQGYKPYLNLTERNISWLSPKNDSQLERAFLNCLTLEEGSSSTLKTPLTLVSPYLPKEESPCQTLARYYRTATTLTQKQACFAYLLQYQCYNAPSDCRHFGYPLPLCSSHQQFGYIRTEFHHLFDLIQTWMKRRSEITVFFNKYVNCKQPELFIKLSSSAASSVLQTFFSQYIELATFDSPNSKDRTKKLIFLIPMALTDFTQTPQAVIEKELKKTNQTLTLKKIRMEFPEARFLFLLQREKIDVVLMWGARWASPKKNDSLKCLSLDHTEMFGNTVFSILNESGAVPDRLSVHHFVTHDLREGYLESLQAFDIAALDIQEKDVPFLFTPWLDQMEKIRSYDFEDDPGCALYRDAILQWSTCFFKKYNLDEFVQALLSNQVAPWMSLKGGIVKWAKAYQNTCEIVMFCLQFFSEDFLELKIEPVLWEILEKHAQCKEVHKSFGLFSYAMSAIFFVFFHILQRAEFKEKPLIIACISQNYFETIDLLEKMASQNPTGKKQILSQKVHSLASIEGTPAILIADIHPNNAAKEVLFQNDVVHWIKKFLGDNPSQTLLLILDLTLNDLSDTDLQLTFKLLIPFITQGRLEIFGIQSLAKLVQLGADNFSGGLCLYLGDLQSPEKHPFFPDLLPQKEAYFSLLIGEFQQIRNDYFGLIRKNTAWMYETLTKQLSTIKERVAQVTLNGDENTVYVAINFKPFLNTLNLNSREEETLVNKFKKWMLEIAEKNSLPLTARQSFGFALSNMNNVVDSIRFSIGIENRALLEQYAALITLFCELLSYYAVDNPHHFDRQLFETNLQTVLTTIKGGEYFFPDILTYKAIPLDRYGSGIYKCEYCRADLQFSKRQLSIKMLQKTSENQPILVNIPQTDLRKGWDKNNAKKWSDFDFIKLFFCLTSLKNTKVEIEHETIANLFRYQIHIMCKNPSVSIEQSFAREFISIKEMKSDIIKPTRAFRLKRENKRETASDELQEFRDMLVSSEKVFANFEELGEIPVRVSKLNVEMRNLLFIKSLEYRFKFIPYEEPGAFYIQFLEKRECLAYPSTIKTLLQTEGIRAVISFLNSVDFNTIPDVAIICDALCTLPENTIGQFTPEDALNILDIKNKECRTALIARILNLFLQLNFDVIKSLDKKVAKAILTLTSHVNCPKPYWRYGDSFSSGGEWMHGYSNANVDISIWIRKAEKYLRENSEERVSLPLFLKALFPLIKQLYSKPLDLSNTGSSLPLRALGEIFQDCFPELQTYMTLLETRLSIRVTDMGWDFEGSLSRYLRLYVKYPLSIEIKRDLLAALKTLSEKTRYGWINPLKLHYFNLPALNVLDANLNQETQEFIKEHKLICEFISEIGCKKLLLDHIDIDRDQGDIYTLLNTLRWAIITQDEELFSKLLSVCQRPSVSQDILVVLKKHRALLDTSMPVQAQIATILDGTVSLFTASKNP
jgi:hypothetical protein